MNLVDVVIIDILEDPKQIITDDVCCWEVVVLTDSWGYKSDRVFRATSKSEIEIYKKGYTWQE